MSEEHRFTNKLSHETSPYLLQHAHNPVNWMPWGDEALSIAKSENKLILVSIGYSACHWCHVMEHESFEDTAVAELMNRYFVCIKVDREERPDVDQVYMDAVQLITGGGGWPLNCFALPDGRPFFGGTYFRKEQWMQVLENVHKTFINSPKKATDWAENIVNGLVEMDKLPIVSPASEFSDELLEVAVARWRTHFDTQDGGPDRAPKFPMPNNYQFLLAWAEAEGDEELMKHVHLTLKKMAYGGIYDQIGGGFARYSTDSHWKVPHFEKMLYDNGQLLSLYSQAYVATKDADYLRVIEETAAWINREMTDESGMFYSALDADSEGEEGKFYVWKYDEIQALAGGDFAVIAEHFNLNHKGLWEHGNYILLREKSLQETAATHKLDVEILDQKIEEFKKKAFAYRDIRVHPGLDDKSLTSWNALASKGLANAYVATGNERWLNLAKTNIDFLLKTQRDAQGNLWHNYKNGHSTVNGYLEDYAHLADALIRLHEITFEAKYLHEAKSIIDFVIDNFDQNENGFFYFKSKSDAPLIAAKVDITDNVIPASNSVLATCLFKLGLFYGQSLYTKLSRHMLAQVERKFTKYPMGYSQWMQLHLYLSQPFYEVAILGENAMQFGAAMRQHLGSNFILSGSVNPSDIPLLQHRHREGQTLIYVCLNGACQLPVDQLELALNFLLKET